MDSKKVQLYLDREKAIEASPVTGANCVILSDGNDLQKVLNNDLTTPTVVHEESSFKTGVGDIDVSSSVVDGEVGRMVIKGKTYQNILPEPSTHVLTNNKEMFKVNEGLDPNVEIVDGVSKSAILSGQTLVNLVPKKIIDHIASSDWDGYCCLVQNSKQSFDQWRTLQDLKPNTKYYISCYVETFEDANNKDYCLNNPSVESIFGDSMIINGVGRYQWLSTTKSELTDEIFIVLRSQNANARGAIKIRDIMIIEYQEGMENWDIPYFEGIQSVKMPVLCTTGKNLFDSSTEIVTGQGINSSNGLPYNYPTHSRTGFLRVKPNTSYTITQSHNKTWVFAYDKNKEYIKVVKTDITSGGNFTTPNDTHYIRLDFNTVDTSEIVNGVQIEEGSIATPYEPYKSNILTVNEEVELRGIGDVQDTLDLMTGELTQKFAMWRVTAEGSHWRKNVDFTPANGYSGFNFKISSEFTNEFLPKLGGLRISCTPFGNWAGNGSANEGTDFHANGKFVIESSKVPVGDLEALRAWLRDNPVYICYELATPTIKTVDLSTSGNWEKIVLDGKSSENWQQNSHSGNFVQFEGYSNFCLYSMNLPVSNRGLLCDKLSYYGYDSKFRHTKVEGISDGGGYRLIFVRVKTEKLPTNDVAGFKQWLSQNPIEVSYMLSSHQDSTQVKQPIFFKDGHIQLSSGADNSLIPTLDYQAKTSNSYVMDLMKTNTKYTMKAKSASGTFTIDGTSYGAGTNGTFTSPTSMTNKLLVMSNKTNEEVMILEGDVTDKTIPYFKGIKSAFEDEDKIEVLSTGKNLFNAYKHKFDTSSSPGLRVEVLSSNSIRTYCTDTVAWRAAFVVYQLEPHTWYNIRCEVTGNGTKQLDINIPEYGTSWNPNTVNCTQSNNMLGKFLTDESGKVKLSFQGSGSESISYDNTYTNIQIEKIQEKSTVHSFYEPHKSNTTKIPLLSPLRSLPNGVCDELIIDRMKKKATLIQRIKSTIFNGSEGWNLNNYSHDKLIEFVCHSGTQMAHTVFSDRFITGGENVERVAFSGGSIYIRILKTKVSNVDSFKKWLSQNPLTVQYGLQTPLITEIDLENFPLVYKDGHIFLNSEIAPVVEIDCNINQSQQIQSNNETLQRHELDILDLDNLIVSFVNAEYNLRLLKFDMELSMMALAE